ncbi:HAD family hydrolase [Pedobacter sp.]|uniref:HAD family hydrolase n=1 Tax=Pedobacter sp. TaxID=1411316 RepID=UPI003D7FBBF9
MKGSKIKVLFFDVGGVLLNNGWGYHSRKLACKQFNLDHEELEILHNFIFNIYEIGKITLDDYLDTVVFYHPRSFSKQEFKDFIFAQSVALPDFLPWLKEWKKTCGFSIISINNEGREINNYRIQKFGLHDCFDAFISSCEVGMRKPDPEIFTLAMGIAQVSHEECLYFDDRQMIVQTALNLGICSYHHQGFLSTRKILEETRS